MGGGGKGGSTTTSSVQIPPEVLARYNAVNAQAQTISEQPYQAYSTNPNAFVAPLTSTQQAGIQNTNAMAGAAQPYYQAATQTLGQAYQGAQPGMNTAYQDIGQAQQQGQNYLGAATATGLAGAQAVNPNALDVNQYMNPYTQNVVNATQAAMGQQFGQQNAAQQAQAIQGGAFGGDRSNLARAALQGQQALAESQAISPLYQQNYNQALAAAQQQQGVNLGAQQANRAAVQQYGQQLGNLGQQGFNQGLAGSQQYGALANQGFNMGNTAANSLAGLGTNAQQAGLAGAQAQMAAGQTEQQTQQAGLQAMYNQFQQQQSYPFQVAQFLANIAEGTGSLSGNTTTSTTTGGGGFFSDKRLKENVQEIGKTNDNQPIYRFNYKGDKNTQIGLMAQDVEKTHPEAVGLAGGYKTVNYKEATKDAVRKADGGAATSNDAYSMNAPSALLQDSGKGNPFSGLSLPQMKTGSDIPIQAGANEQDIAAMRAPKATGVSPGSIEGAQAYYSSLMGGKPAWSGQAWQDQETQQLRDFLTKNNATIPGGSVATDPTLAASSQGGLVSEPGTFARGGLAGARHNFAGDGYVNPALEYYTKLATQNPGLAGILSQGNVPHSAPQAIQAPKPQQHDAVAEANQMANLATTGAKFYDWAKTPSKTSAGYDDVFVPGADNEKTLIDLNTPTDLPAVEPERRGGLIAGRHHYANAGYVDPYGGSGLLGGVLQQQSQQPQYHEMKGGEMPRQKPQQSGLGELSQMASLGKSGKGAYDWAAKQLAGEASPTALGSAAGDSASVASGLGGAAAEDAAGAGLAGAADTAALDAGLAGAADAGIAGAADLGLTAAAPEALAAAGAESGLDFLPFLFLKDGGTVPHRRHFDGSDGSYVAPTDPDTVVSQSRSKNQTVLTPADAIVTKKAPKAGLAPLSDEDTSPSEAASPSVFGGLGSLGGIKDTLTSENFLVPALAGIGSMLASPNKTLLGAIGSGLVGGTGAYTGLQKQQNEIMAKRLEMMKGVFSGPYFMPDGKTPYWKMAGNPNPLTQEQYQEASSRYLGMPTATGSAALPPVSSATRAPSSTTTELAKSVVSEPAPAMSRAAQPPAAAAPPAPAAAQPAAPAVNAAEAPTPSPIPPVTSVISGNGPTEAQMRAAALAPGSRAFDGLPVSQDPRILLPKIDALDKQINDASEFVKNATARGIMSPEIQQQMTQQEALATRLLKQRDDLSKAAEASVQSVIGIPVAAARKTAEINAENAAKIAALPAQKQAELKATLEARASTDPLDVKKATDTAVAEALGKFPTEQAKYAFEQNYNRQMAAQKSAAGMADEGQQLLNQANAYMAAAFDKDGKPLISGGPLGKKLGTLSQYLQQVGFSPEFARDLTGTDPNAVGAATKLQTTFASEMARMDLTKAPAVREFSNYMATSPGPDLPHKTLQWLVNNVIKPKAESMKGAYTRVIDMDPGKNNIEKSLYQYKNDNPWFKIGTPPPGAGTAETATTRPQFTAAELAAERQRRANAQGVQ